MKDIIHEILEAGIETKRHCIETNADNLMLGHIVWDLLERKLYPEAF